ncbi:MAG: glycosyltransferase family 4 protein [Reyranellaceae bacterium]
MPAANSVLLITLPPGLGGIATQSRMAADLLRAQGHAVTAAWRAHYSTAPQLSVPSWKPWRRVGSEASSELPYPGVAVGSHLPEFEWAHHLANAHWRRLIDSHEKIVVVSGNVLPAWAPHALKRKSLNWIASPWWGDREARVAAWPAWRRAYDALLNAPVARRQEKILLRDSDTWAIGDYACRELRALVPVNRVHGIIVIPVDTGLFRPADEPRPGGGFRIGVSGRISDPRKNMALLVQGFARFLAHHPDAELHVRGDLAREDFIARFQAQAIAQALQVGPPVPRAQMPQFLRSLDCFAVTSQQEGLSQIAMEAMACGACVVSTRCGGPEEFVLDGDTGLLTGFEPAELADAFARLAGEPALGRRLGAAGAALIARRYSQARFEEQFLAALAQVFP